MLAIPSVRTNIDYAKFIAGTANDNIPGAVRASDRHLNPGIFREYDIRGIVGETLYPQDAYYIARAFAAKAGAVQPRIICVGRDGRLSSPTLHDAVCQGIIDSGFDVIDVGIGPTPMLYYASHTSAAAGGIMITGSHNPPDHNGLKFVCQRGPFYGDDIRMLRTIANAGAFTDGYGRREIVDIRADYMGALLKCYKGGPLNVAWDAGNGATGDIMSVLCHKLPGQHIALNAVIDGGFPAHHPDPGDPETLNQLISVVTGHGLDAGIAFDGDGDHIGVVDDEGEIICGDQLLMLFADQHFGYNDALYTALRLLNLLSHSGQKLSQLRKTL